jgi:hypothetical protein
LTQSALDADHLLTQARAATGLHELGEGAWREGLDTLIGALNREAGLNEIGVQVATADVQAYLSSRLQITDWHRQHPALAREDIVPPIVIVGQGRTGTTILFDLLAQDPAHRVPLTWEVDRPYPPPATATYDTDPRIAEVDAQLAMSELLVPDLKRMHPMGARLAQECVRITGGDFRSMIFPTQYRVPSYARWLLHETDMASAYRWHRRFLQYLQSGHRGERWVLKSPGHVWCLPSLLAEYPNALLVQTHRDPLRIVASLSSLIATLRRMASDETSIPEAGAEFADYLLDGLNRSVAVRESGAVPRGRIVDVQFAAFMADPFVTIRTVYDRLGLELTQEAERRMRAFLASNPSDKHGAHAYTWKDTGLDEGEMRERARRYQQYFDVPSERLG